MPKKEQLKRIAAPDEHLRISVDSGGCSGFEYKMELDKAVNSDEDEVIRVSDGATVVIDKVLIFLNEKRVFQISLEFLRGSKLDYVEDLMRAAFRITVFNLNKIF